MFRKNRGNEPTYGMDTYLLFFFFRKVIEFPIGIQNTGRYLNKWKYILLKVNYNN